MDSENCRQKKRGRRERKRAVVFGKQVLEPPANAVPSHEPHPEGSVTQARAQPGRLCHLLKTGLEAVSGGRQARTRRRQNLDVWGLEDDPIVGLPSTRTVAKPACERERRTDHHGEIMIPFSPRIAMVSTAVLVAGSTGYFGHDFWTNQALLLRRLDSLEAQLNVASRTASTALAQEEPVESFSVSNPILTTHLAEATSADEAVTAAQELAAARQRELSEARETIGLLTRQIAELQQSLQESQAQKATLALRDQQLLEMRTQLEAALTARSSAPMESAPAARPYAPPQPLQDRLAAAAAPMSTTATEPAAAVAPAAQGRAKSATAALASATEVVEPPLTAVSGTEVVAGSDVAPATGVVAAGAVAASPPPVQAARVVTNEPRTIERSIINPEETPTRSSTQPGLTASLVESRRVDAPTTAGTRPATPPRGPILLSPSIPTEIAVDTHAIFDDSGWRSSRPAGGF
jgi:hypothetical protein